MKILAHGHYSETVTDALPPLKALVKDTTGTAIRRVGRFIQLALIGAGRCLHEQTAEANTAVYLSSERGDLEITLEVLEQMIEHGLPPKPLSFINTVSNSACFYIAKHFGLHGRSQFVTRRYAPLASALQLAMLDLHTGSVNTALVGSVDICTEPLDDHRKRLGVAADTNIGEGSHWFLLGNNQHPSAAIATLDTVLQLADNTALQQWLTAQQFIPSNTVLACGQHVNNNTAKELHALCGFNHTLAIPADRPWYDSHCGEHIAQFLRECPARTLLHIDTDADERFTIVQISLP